MPYFQRIFPISEFRHGRPEWDNTAVFYIYRNMAVSRDNSYDFSLTGKLSGVKIIPFTLRENDFTFFLSGKQRSDQDILADHKLVFHFPAYSHRIRILSCIQLTFFRLCFNRITFFQIHGTHRRCSVECVIGKSGI